MKTAAIILFLGTAFAAPQFDFKSLTGDDESEEVNEQVPYTTVEKFDVSILESASKSYA